MPGESVRIKRPHGIVLSLHVEDGSKVCPTCKGQGYWDSCFECGNRGTIPVGRPDDA